MKAADKLVVADKETSALRLSKIVRIQNEVHELKNALEFGVYVTNETHNVEKYFQAVFWSKSKLNRVEIKSVSGVSSVEPNAIITQFMRRLVRFCLDLDKPEETVLIELENTPNNLSDDWGEMMPPYLLWMPFSENERIEAGMLIFLEEPLEPASSMLLGTLAQAYSSAWYRLPENLKRDRSIVARTARSNRSVLILLGLLLLSGFIPVRESSLAPASVVATNPKVVSSSIEGVIQDIHVEPNQTVAKGDLLVSLDSTQAQSDADIAEKDLNAARTEYLIESQKMLQSDDDSGRVALLKSEMESAKLKQDLANSILNRTQIFSPDDGIAIFTDKYEFLGKPAITGQRIMLLADVNSIELDIYMPVGDSIDFQVGDEVRLFLNTDPTSPVSAKIRQTSFEPRINENNEFAFKMKARFDDPTFVGRIGWQGTAKVYGAKRVSLFMYLFRRPISTLRRTFGI